MRGGAGCLHGLGQPTSQQSVPTYLRAPKERASPPAHATMAQQAQRAQQAQHPEAPHPGATHDHVGLRDLQHAPNDIAPRRHVDGHTRGAEVLEPVVRQLREGVGRRLPFFVWLMNCLACARQAAILSSFRGLQLPKRCCIGCVQVRTGNLPPQSRPAPSRQRYVSPHRAAAGAAGGGGQVECNGRGGTNGLRESLAVVCSRGC